MWLWLMKIPILILTKYEPFLQILKNKQTLNILEFRFYQAAHVYIVSDSDLWVLSDVRLASFADLTDVTLTDEDINTNTN